MRGQPETPQRGPQRVEVRQVADPDGQPAVLLQLPDGWLVVTPREARRVAGLLLAVADEIVRHE